jgi:hypothetical protein
VRLGSGVGGRGTSGFACLCEVRSKSKSASSAVAGVAIVIGGKARQYARFGSSLWLTCVDFVYGGAANNQTHAR